MVDTEKSLWGFASDNKKYKGGKISSTEIDFSTGPFQVLLDCDEATLTIMNMSNQKKYTISEMLKIKKIPFLNGGGFFPYFNLKKCTVVITHISHKKFGEIITDK